MPDSRSSYRGHALLVGNDQQFFDALSQTLRKAHFAVTHAESAEAAVVLLAASLQPDIAVIDAWLPDETGIQLASKLRQTRHCPFILFTERGEIEAMKKSVPGAFACLDKSMTSAAILKTVQAAMRHATEQESHAVPGKKLAGTTGRKRYPAVPRSR